MLYKKYILFSILILFSACSSNSLTNLSDAKYNIKKYYEEGQYNKELNSIVDLEIEYFEKYKTKPNDAVVFDVDETVLDSYQYIKSIDYGYDFDLWNKWMDKAEALQIEPAKRLYNYFVQKGIKIIFLTGRSYYSCDATYKNLINVGFDKFDTLICRNKEEIKKSSLEYKTYHRKELSQNGYNIIACVGDQETDLIGGYTGKTIKFPNYIYKID
ncbi:MAG: HAD family acid phosphatase [bacterium]